MNIQQANNMIATEQHVVMDELVSKANGRLSTFIENRRYAKVVF